MKTEDILKAATPRPWRMGKSYSSIVSDDPTTGNRVVGFDAVEAYGGYMVAESVGGPDKDLIVLAVNSYEKQRECIAELVEWLEQCSMAPNYRPAELNRVIARAKALLE